MSLDKEAAVCRGCKRELIGKPYRFGGDAYHPKTGERCPVNQYGGFVCSEECDRKSSKELEATMPGAGNTGRLSCFAEESLRRNWGS